MYDESSSRAPSVPQIDTTGQGGVWSLKLNQVGQRAAAWLTARAEGRQARPEDSSRITFIPHTPETLAARAERIAARSGEKRPASYGRGRNQTTPKNDAMEGADRPSTVGPDESARRSDAVSVGRPARAKGKGSTKVSGQRPQKRRPSRKVEVRRPTGRSSANYSRNHSEPRNTSVRRRRPIPDPLDDLSERILRHFGL